SATVCDPPSGRSRCPRTMARHRVSRSRSRSSEATEIRAELATLAPLVAAERIARPTPQLAARLGNIDRAQLIIDLYESRQLAAQDRKRSGVFYTPAPVISAMLDRLPTEGEWLDPACGAGAFLVALARRHGASILNRLSACDVDRDALDAAAFALEAVLGSQ